MTAQCQGMYCFSLHRLLRMTLQHRRHRLPGPRDIRDLPDHLKRDLGLFEVSDEPGSRDASILRALRRRTGER